MLKNTIYKSNVIKGKIQINPRNCRISETGLLNGTTLTDNVVYKASVNTGNVGKYIFGFYQRYI